jgi:hypothetical protein
MEFPTSSALTLQQFRFGGQLPSSRETKVRDIPLGLFPRVAKVGNKQKVRDRVISTPLRSKTCNGICSCDRRGFLKGAAGIIGGTAMASLLKAQPQASSSASAVMFDGFKISKVQTTGATINMILGGQGPPVLLLHGNPQTHVMWHKIAPRLAREFTVVARYEA